LTTRQGCPISVAVYEGNTADPKTLMPQVSKLKESFGLERVVLVGDRGMISHKAIGELKTIEGMAWITALKSSQIRALVEAGALQLGLFDERNLFELTHPARCAEPHAETPRGVLTATIQRRQTVSKNITSFIGLDVHKEVVLPRDLLFIILAFALVGTVRLDGFGLRLHHCLARWFTTHVHLRLPQRFATLGPSWSASQMNYKSNRLICLGNGRR
jgi:hypothetical protein